MMLIVPVVLIAVAGPAAGETYSLDECVEIALANNVSLATARENLEGAGADVMSAWSGALPRISAGLNRYNYLTVSEGTDTASRSYSGSLTLSQPLFRGGAVWAGISQARHTQHAYEHDLESTRREVVFGVKQGYYGLLKAERLREVAEEALELAREQMRKTESLFDLGSASKSDLLKAQVQVGQAQLSLIGAQKNLESSRAALCYMLGIDVLTPLEAVDPEPNREKETLEFDLASAVSRRPDVKGKEEVVLAASRALTSAKAGRWPDLDLSVSYSRSKSSVSGLFDDMEDDYSRTVGLSLSLPLFDGLQTKSSIASRKSNLRAYELSLRDTRLAAAYEIETSRLAVLESRERVEVAGRSVEHAQEDLKISEERYRLRAASMLELIDARVAFSTVRAEMVEAQYDYEIAKAELTKALGL